MATKKQAAAKPTEPVVTPQETKVESSKAKTKTAKPTEKESAAKKPVAVAEPAPVIVAEKVVPATETKKSKSKKTEPIVAAAEEVVIVETPAEKPAPKKGKAAEAKKAAEPVVEAAPEVPAEKPKKGKAAAKVVEEEPEMVIPEVIIEEIEIIEKAAPAPKVKEPKAPKPPKPPVKKAATLAQVERKNLAAKAALGQPPAPRPMATPAAKPVDKKPSIIIAHRKLENKSRQTPEADEIPVYQPEVYRSLLDDAPPPPKTIYRYNDEDLAEFRELISNRLEAARKELIYLQGVITRKDEAGTEDTENRFMNVEDGSGAMEREQLAQLAGRQIQFVNHLEKALIRIENKTYGVCRVTGKLIEKARLRAVPHATLSIEAKKMMNTKQN